MPLEGGMSAKAIAALGVAGDPKALLWLAVGVFSVRAALGIVTSIIDGIAQARVRRGLQETCFRRLLEGRWDALRDGNVGQWVGALTEESGSFAKYVMSAARSAYHLLAFSILAGMAAWLSPKTSVLLGFCGIPAWLALRKLYARQSTLSSTMAVERQYWLFMIAFTW